MPDSAAVIDYTKIGDVQKLADLLLRCGLQPVMYEVGLKVIA